MLRLHPSVILNISDHHTRAKANRPDIVVGALLGKRLDRENERSAREIERSPREIEITDSFELCIIKPNIDGASSDVQSADVPLIDKDFKEKRIPLAKQLPEDLELVGWYSTVPPSRPHLEVLCCDSLHRQVGEFITNPVYIKFNPYKRESGSKVSRNLPLEAFRPVREIIANEQHINFVEVEWTIVTEDVEILSVDHNLKMTQIDKEPSTAIDYLRSQHSAVKMLRDRIKVITKFVKDVQSGALPYHEEPIADIVALCQRFPLMNSDSYTRAYNMQCNDVALFTYLGILTKGSIDKMNFGKPSSKARALSTTHARR